LKKLTLIFLLLLLCGTTSAIASDESLLINLNPSTSNSSQIMVASIFSLGAGIAIASAMHKHNKASSTTITTTTPGEISASNVIFSTPGSQNLTITNNTSENVNVTNVNLQSTIHNITVGSLADCQNLAKNGGVCNISLTAAQNSYGSGNAIISYSSTTSSSTATVSSSVTVANTSIGTQYYIDLEPDQLSQFFTITNTGNFTWQFLDPSSASFVLGSSLTGVTSDFSDCTSKTMTPGTSCNIKFDTSGANPGDNTTLEIKGKNIDTYTSNVTILGEFVVEVDTDPTNLNQSYRALKVSNTSTANLTGRITEVTSDIPTKIHFCAHDDTSCPVNFRSTCVLNQDISAGDDCLIWLQALDVNQSIETDNINVTVKGSTTNNQYHQKSNATFDHSFDIDYSKSLYAGGYFTTAGGITANYIAKWNGSNWSALGSGMDNHVYALTHDYAGNLYAGGLFTTAGGNLARFIAKWNGSTWSALGSGMSYSVNALSCDNDGNLYAGGQFITAGGITVNYIAKWDGSNWSALGSGMNSHVRALTYGDDGNLYAGGSFTTAGGITVNYIAKWDGSNWSALGSGMSYSTPSLTTVNALTHDAGNIYAGGLFTTAGGITVNHIAKWDGSNWSALGSGMDNYIRALIYDNNVNIYAGGNFTTPATRIAKWDGSNWSALGSGMDLEVEALAHDNAGNLYAGGQFTTAGGIAVNCIAKWDGSNWYKLGSGMNNYVYAFDIVAIIDSIKAID
jgi:hypothetical protein